jgi:hypothetical protein
MGLRLRDRLKDRLRRWPAVTMLTLTLDPQLHASPQEAWKYCQDKRAVAETVRRLEQWGYMQAVEGKREWFAVLEWQENGWPHWHVLIPTAPSSDLFAALKRAWNMNWPEWEARVSIGRPGFGAVRFTTDKSLASDHAANYACKYVIKYPERGFPDWVLDGNRKGVHRFTAARGFWGYSTKAESLDGQEAEQAEDFPMGGTCQADAGMDPSPDRVTVRQVLDRCGKSSNLFEVVEIVNKRTGEVRQVRHYVATLPAPLADVRDTIVAEEYPTNGRSLLFDLKGPGWVELLRQAKGASGAPEDAGYAWPTDGDDIPF